MAMLAEIAKARAEAIRQATQPHQPVVEMVEIRPNYFERKK